MLHLGVVGCGEQANSNLLPALRNIHGSQIIGVCDVLMERAERVAHWFGIKGAYRDYRDLINSGRVDALILAGPPQMHVEVAFHALEARIPVFVEKPPSVTTAELEKLIEAAQANRVVTAVGHNFRYARPYKVFHELAHAEDFGKPLSLQIRFLASKPKQPMWGLGCAYRSFLLAQVIHPVDLMLQWLGGDYELTVDTRVAANGGILLQCCFKGNHLSGTIVTGSLAPSFIFEAFVVSDRSRLLELDGLWNITYRHEPMASAIATDKSWRLVSEPSPLDTGYIRAGYQGELEAFVSAVVDGAKGPPTFEEELPVYHALDRIEHLAKASRTSA